MDMNFSPLGIGLNGPSASFIVKFGSFFYP